MNLSPLRLSLLATVAGLALVCGSYIATAGKPAPAPPLPPVRYQIQFFDTPNPAADGATLLDMNNAGQCVGYYFDALGWKRAFFYDPAIDSANAFDLNTIAAAPDGWVVAAGTGINDQGVVVGYLEPEGSPWDPNFRKGFVVDTAAATPTLSLLPDSQWDYAAAFRINENGDIVGGYRNADKSTWGLYLFNPSTDPEPLVLGIDILSPWYLALNNPTNSRDIQISGVLIDESAFRWTRGGPLETIIPASSINGPAVYDMNDSGTVCGWVYAKLGKNRYEQRPMRFTNSLEVLPSGYFSAGSINASGDVSLGSGVYHDGWGAINMDTLIDSRDPDAALWFSSDRSYFSLLKINDRLAGPGFGQFGAAVVFGNAPTRLCVLTPVSVSP